MGKKCIICNNNNIWIIYKDHPGYIKGNRFDIYECKNCNSQFISTDQNIEEIYDAIYSSSQTPGYDRYYQYAEIIKSKKYPLKYLAYNESTYFPVYQFVKDKKNLKILEIGCGYGYLSYALYQEGFNVTGIDISSSAIEYARKNFGDYFINTGINDNDQLMDEKFDLIISTEVIEHSNDPNSFLENCISLLKQDGHIILTTPNKDFYNQDAVWQTDLPPVHFSWLGIKGMEVLAEKHSLSIIFTDFSHYYSRSENRLVKYLRTRKERIGNSLLTKDGMLIHYKNTYNFSLLHNSISYLLHKIYPIRELSNFMYNKFKGNDITLGVILYKR